MRRTQSPRAKWRALLTPGLIVTVFIISPAGRISSWTVVQYECFSRPTILAAAQNEPIGQQPLTAPPLSKKRGYGLACSPNDNSFVAFARLDLASGINSRPNRSSPCLLQGRRRTA